MIAPTRHRLFWVSLVTGLLALTTALPPLHAETRSVRGPRGQSLPAGTQVFPDMAYIPNGHARQKLDLYLPSRTTVVRPPLVVWIHGGGWSGGSKDSPRAAFLLERGYAVASINYRLSQHEPFPAQIEDCKAAIRWLRAHAPQYNFDPDRIAVWGQSAGAHLASLLGTSGDTDRFDIGPHLRYSARVQAVINFCGPTDLNLYGQSRQGDTLTRFIGGLIQQNQEKVRDANPITFVSENDPPFLILHGDQDRIVAPRHSELLHEALRKVNVASRLIIRKGDSHALVAPDTRESVIEFLSEHLPATSRQQATR